jgi:hypothetical protein
MSIELLLILVVVALGGVAVWYFNKGAKSADLNSDGKTDVKDALVAVENTVAGVKAAADVNKDGKLDSGDVKVVAEKAKKGAKKAVGKAKAATAKATAKKPKAKKQ